MSVLQFLTTVHFGHGMRRELPRLLTAAGVQRPLLVTDPGVMRAGVFAQAVEDLPDSHRGSVFSDVPVNPTEAAAFAGAQAYRLGRCDGIVGIGGGAALDLAKAIAVLATNAPPLWDYCNRHPQPKAIVAPPPLFLLPTTAGTGSEVGRSAVIVFDNGIKAGVRCPDLVTAAICDPDLTLALPPAITATTGMDALSHCIETYCSPVV
ncbi:MAG: iron-containing alcohol dehydrogenase, partial [Comamonadaceae bacterium]